MYKIIQISNLIDIEKTIKLDPQITSLDSINFLKNIINVYNYSFVNEYRQYIKFNIKDGELLIKINTKKIFDADIIHNYSSSVKDLYGAFPIRIICSFEDNHSFNYRQLMLFIDSSGNIESMYFIDDTFFKSSDPKILFSKSTFVLVEKNV